MKKSERARKKRHNRIKRHMIGVADRPRVYLYRSLKNISATAIDDAAQKVIASASTAEKEFKLKNAAGGNVKAAGSLGEVFAERMKKKGIQQIIFDRSGYLYHGRVKAFAEELRKGGLEF